jgi:Ca-activated chloride channel homolog
LIPTGKTTRSIRKKSLEEIFMQLKKGGSGGHKSPHTGKGLERQPETRRWQPGDDISQIDSVGTMMNMLNTAALINSTSRKMTLKFMILIIIHQ